MSVFIFTVLVLALLCAFSHIESVRGDCGLAKQTVYACGSTPGNASACAKKGMIVTVTSTPSKTAASWQFSSFANSFKSYTVTFVQMYEIDSAGVQIKDSVTDFSQWTWNFCSEEYDDEDEELPEIEFDFTGKAPAPSQAVIRITNEMNNFANTSALKWSLSLDGYQSKANATFSLVFKFSFTAGSSGNTVLYRSPNVALDNAVISAAPTAVLTSAARRAPQTIAVSQKDQTNYGKGYFLTFSDLPKLRGTESLFLDPTFTISSTSVNDGLTSGEIAAIVFGVLLILAIGGSVGYYFYNKSHNPAAYATM